MGIFDLFKPNVEKMKEKRDVKGLIKALLYKNDRNVQNQAAKALGNIGESAVEPLIQALKKEKGLRQEGVQEESAKALVNIGKPAVKHLIQVLEKDQNETLLYKSAVIIGEIGDKSVIPQLVSLYNKTSAAPPPVPWRLDCPPRYIPVGCALIRLGDDRALTPIMKLLSHSDENLRNHAVFALGMYRDKRAVYLLMQVLLDEIVDISLRANAAWSLGNICDNRALELLKRVSDSDPGGVVGKEAAKSLSKIKNFYQGSKEE